MLPLAFIFVFEGGEGEIYFLLQPSQDIVVTHCEPTVPLDKSILALNDSLNLSPQ